MKPPPSSSTNLIPLTPSLRLDSATLLKCIPLSSKPDSRPINSYCQQAQQTTSMKCNPIELTQNELYYSRTRRCSVVPYFGLSTPFSFFIYLACSLLVSSSPDANRMPSSFRRTNAYLGSLSHVSMYASSLSAVTYIGLPATPTRKYRSDCRLLRQSAVAPIILKLYQHHRHQVTTSYQFIQNALALMPTERCHLICP